MHVDKTDRGFELIAFRDAHARPFSVQQSSAIGDYEDAMERPGASFLWIGPPEARGHIDREQAADLARHLKAWAETGSLAIRNAGPVHEQAEPGNGGD